MPQEEGKQVEEGVVESGTQTEAQSTPPQQEEKQYTATELKAMEQGWKPLDDWTADGHDPEEHRSAREFLDRGELLGKIKTIGAENRKFQEMMQHLSAQNQRVFQAGYEKALTDLKAQRAQAMKDGDIDTALQLEDKIDQTKDAIRALKTPAREVPQGPSPVYQEWLKDNSWYLSDRVMHNFTNAIAGDYGLANPGASEQEVYEYIDKELRRNFPDKFRPKSAVRSAPQPDGQGRKAGSASGANKSGKDAFDELVSQFNELDARAARNLVKQGYVTKEKYVEDYYANAGGR